MSDALDVITVAIERSPGLPPKHVAEVVENDLVNARLLPDPDEEPIDHTVPQPFEPDWLDDVNPRDLHGRSYRETAAETALDVKIQAWQKCADVIASTGFSHEKVRTCESFGFDWHESLAALIEARGALNEERSKRRALQRELEATSAENRHLANNLDVQRAGRTAAEAKVARAHALADRWEHGALRWEEPLEVPPEVGQLRDALKDGE